MLPPSDAAHIRSGSIIYGKRSTGLGEKPHDRWAVPLNRSCHTRQHAFGSEVEWWNRHGKDPFHLALKYNARYTAETGKPAEGPLPAPVSKATPRSNRAKSARSPARKAKIANRPNSWPAKGTRKIPSRRKP